MAATELRNSRNPDTEEVFLSACFGTQQAIAMQMSKQTRVNSCGTLSVKIYSRGRKQTGAGLSYVFENTHFIFLTLRGVAYQDLSVRYILVFAMGSLYLNLG